MSFYDPLRSSVLAFLIKAFQNFRQRIGECKTIGSEQSLFISPEMLEVLKTWRQSTQFSSPNDWVFASPAQIGRLPWSADAVNDAYQKAAKKAGIAPVSTHCMRHSTADIIAIGILILAMAAAFVAVIVAVGFVFGKVSGTDSVKIIGTCVGGSTISGIVAALARGRRSSMPRIPNFKGPRTQERTSSKHS